MDAKARWNKEKPCPDNTLDMQGKKVGFSSWYNRKYDDYTCEEFYAPQGHKDCVRTADLTLEDAVDRELKDDDPLKESDWRERTVKPLLRLGEVPTNLKPNRKRAEIYFKDDEKKLLPTSFAAEEHKRTLDQILSELLLRTPINFYEDFQINSRRIFGAGR